MEEAAKSAFPFVKNHVLLPKASRMVEADKLMRQAITPRTLDKIVDLLPDAWLDPNEYEGKTPQEIKNDYKKYLNRRLKSSSVFIEKAVEEYNQIKA